MACIRRANLDAFWSRSADTVSSHVGQVKMMISLADLVGIRPPIPSPGPLPAFDHCGYGVAVEMLLKSRLPGTYHSTHQQWDTIRKLRTAYTNSVRASGKANTSVNAVCDGEKERVTRDSATTLARRCGSCASSPDVNAGWDRIGDLTER